MQKISRLYPAVSSVSLAIFVVVILVSLIKDSPERVGVHFSGINQVKITKSELLKNAKFLSQHDSETMFVLVEFGDYQCEPCRQIDGTLRKLMAVTKGRLVFCFRNFPISTIHPLAFDAAIVAQSSTGINQFRMIHEALYRRPLNPKEDLEAIVRKNGIKLCKKAMENVDRDIAIAKKIGLHSTPSLFFCALDGAVYEVSDVKEIWDFIRAYHMPTR